MHAAPADEAALEERLSRPSAEVSEALRVLDGDVLVLGAGGKMGPSLARMARRALDEDGVSRTGRGARQVYAVSRFSDASLHDALAADGVVPLRADLRDARAVAALPDAPNVLHMVGQKFGTQHDPAGTWMQNVGVSVYVANRYAGARVVVFSTGNVYAPSPVAAGGVHESEPMTASGEYAASCIGRERVFEYSAAHHGTRVLQYRLCYACDLRYGVLTDIAALVHAGVPVPLGMGYANVIWQGDANALALRALTRASTQAPALNVSGPVISVRQVAQQLAARMGVAVQFSGTEARDALLVSTKQLHEALPFDALPTETLIDWTADWVQRGGRLLGKPTRFDVQSGTY